MRAVRISLILSAALLAFAPLAQAATAPNYKILDRIKVQDGGFDYATFDAATNRIYMARPDLTTVIDVKTGKVSDLKSAVRGHIVLPIPGTTLAVLTQRTGTVRIVDLATDKALADLPAGKNPDGAVYDPFSKLVFAMNHDSGNATIVDVTTRKPVGNIQVNGELEFPVSDGQGKIFVNNEADPADIAVIDVKSRTVATRYKLAGCEEATGLAYVADAKLLVSSCGNGVLKVLEAPTGKEVASVPIGEGADAVIYDAARKLAFIPCGGAGVLEVVSFADLAHIAVVQHVQTLPGSRTGTLDPGTGRVYLMSSKPDPKAPPGTRGARLAGSYEVLVVGP
jgi:DNA-binding beta-propeller fold protein YncE